MTTHPEHEEQSGPGRRQLHGRPRRQRGVRSVEPFDAGEPNPPQPAGRLGRREGRGPADQGGPRGPHRRGKHRGGRMRRGDVRLAMLALLDEKPMNGYQMIQAIAERTNQLWKPSPGAIYPALSQLQDEQLVEAAEVDGQKAFQLTAAGRKLAADINPKPWEQVVRESRSGGDGFDELRRAFDALEQEVRSVATIGSENQVQAVTVVLVEAQRQIEALR